MGLIFGYLFNLSVIAQDKLSSTRAAIALSGPEMFNAGMSVDLGKINQMGFYGGIGPSLGTVWTSLNLEHRLYVGKVSEATDRKKWFLRQGYTYYPQGNDSAITLTVGKELKSKHLHRGWVIDLGVFYLPGIDASESSIGNVVPALRFQYYGYILKNFK